MLKVLIADDEKKVCQLISHLVKWEDLGFEVVGIVNDGVSAYRFVEQNEVDVLITDVRMPECDGMELIAKVRDMNPEIHFIIISGYSQFEYAQTAIRFGVEDYLLKPIRKKDLTSTLMKIAETHQMERQNEAEQESIKKRLLENEKKLKENLLDDLLGKPEEFSRLFSAERANLEYHYNFSDVIYQPVIIKPMLPMEESDADTRGMLLRKTLSILQEALVDYTGEQACQIIGEEIFCLFNGNEEQIAYAAKKLKKVKLDIIRLQDVFDQVQVFIGLGTQVHRFEDVRSGFKAAKRALYNRFYHSEQMFLSASDLYDKEEALNNIINNSFKKRFLSYIEIMDLNGIGVEMKSLNRSLEKDEYKCGELILDTYKEVVTLFYFGTHNYGIGIPDRYNALMDMFGRFRTIRNVTGYLGDYIISSLSAWFEQKKDVESKPIRIAKQYIGENYYQPLTLELVSSQVGFHPTYFSTMFKKETDKNFSEYLMDVRIENAKRMLLNTNDDVMDISVSVGYADVKYFSRIFKKTTGLTPTEFRRLYN